MYKKDVPSFGFVVDSFFVCFGLVFCFVLFLLLLLVYCLFVCLGFFFFLLLYRLLTFTRTVIVQTYAIEVL